MKPEVPDLAEPDRSNHLVEELLPRRTGLDRELQLGVHRRDADADLVEVEGEEGRVVRALTRGMNWRCVVVKRLEGLGGRVRIVEKEKRGGLLGR